MKRVLLVTSDLDVVSPLRVELERRGMAVALVTASRDSETTIEAFRPEVAAVHLSPRCFGAFSVVGLLHSRGTTRDLPLMFLLDDSAQPKDIAFFTAGVRTLISQQRESAAELGSRLSLALKVTAKSAV